MAENRGKNAFVTLITSDAYLPGALALVATLKELHLPPQGSSELEFETVCLVTPETVDVSTIKLLRQRFDVVVGVEVIGQPDEANLRLLGRPDLNTVLTKLHVFRLTQYQKIVFLDADVLPLRSLSHLFSIPHPFAAVPDVGWPDIFNSGVFVFSPSGSHFDELQSLLSSNGSWDGGDQGILNEWRGSDWHRLSFTYNTTPTAAYTYAPAYKRFGSDISAIHFIGPNKPWHSIPYRAPGSDNSMLGQEDEPQQAYHYSALVDRWFNVYDRHYRAQPVTVPESQTFAPQRYSSAWDQASTSQPQENVEGTPFTLDELRQLAMEGIIGSGFGQDGRNGEHGGGNYTILPLEGRFDLMRKPEPKNEIDEIQDEEDPTTPIPSRLPELPLTWEEPPQWEISGSNSDHSAHNYHTQTLPYVPRPEQQPREQWFKGLEERRFNRHRHEQSGRFDGGQNYGRPQPGAQRHDIPGQERSQSHSERRPSLSRRRSSRNHHHQHQDRGTAENYRHSAPAFEDELEYYQPHDRRPMQEHNRRGSHSKLRYQQNSNTKDHFGTRQTEKPEQYPKKHPEKHSEQRRDQQFQSLQFQRPSNERLNSQRNDQPPERPRSPPLMSWNPAIEPPPSDMPQSSAFPPDTYFPNIWDAPPSKENDAPRQQPSNSYPVHSRTSHFPSKAMSPPPQPQTETFFSPPQLSGIPEALLREGHYRNVTGDSVEGSVPSPDPSKVNRVFPWEEKPRHAPSRIFPGAEAPQHNTSVYDSPKPSSAETSPRGSGPSRSFQSTPSPLIGLPTSLTFANAWDAVPSITRYATRLTRPPPSSNALAPPFEEGRWPRRGSDSFRSWDERVEASSRDGDDEDEGDDDHTQETLWEDDSDQDASKHRSRSGSVSSTTVQEKKQYVTRGVQTATREMRSAATQVEPKMPEKKTKEVQTLPPGPTNPPPQTKRSWPSETPRIPPAATSFHKTLGTQLSLTPAVPPPQFTSKNTTSSPLVPSLALMPPGRSSRSSSGSSSSPARSQANSPMNAPRRQAGALQTHRSPSLPQKPSSAPPMNFLRTSKPQSRRFSADGPSTNVSPPSSMSPPSPLDQRPTNSVKIGGRHWDPARGVDLFKQSSEEVLARFLKMGSWEEGRDKDKEQEKKSGGAIGQSEI